MGKHKRRCRNKCSCQCSPIVLYVDANTRSFCGNGFSWCSAFRDLQFALDAAKLYSVNVQIWIAAGTYKPTVRYAGGYNVDVPNLVTFLLPNNTSLYGGFAGCERCLCDRNPIKNVTILSGDILGDDINIPENYENKSDNAWHVLTADGVVNVLIDGITVQDGYAGGPDAGTVAPASSGTIITSITYAHDNGGGLIARHGAKVTLNNTNFRYNVSNNINATINSLNPPIVAIAGGGGAISSIDPGTVVTINNSIFNNNSAINFVNTGGALNTLLDGKFIICGSIFTANLAFRVGGAIHARDADEIIIKSSTFSNNRVTGALSSDESGGAIVVLNNSLTITKCTFNSNVSTVSLGGGGAVFFQIPFNDGEAYKLIVTDSAFTNNSTSDFGGGGILIFGVQVNPGTLAVIINCSFNDNVGGVGGAIYADSIPTTITGCSFTNNKAWVEGGAILGGNFADAIFDITNINDRSVMTVIGSRFTGNTIIGVPSGSLPPVLLFGALAFGISLGFGLPPAGVTALAPGGGAIASELGGNIHVFSSTFNSNSAPNGNGGAILVGGSQGFAGLGPLAMNQAFLSIATSSGGNNSDQTGINNVAVLDPAGLGNNPNGVQFVTDGSFQ